MTCASCGDHGLIRCNWTDAPDDFAICLCAAGQAWRCDTNAGKRVDPLWLSWCAKNQVAPSRMFLMEEVLTPAELHERGFGTPAAVATDDALIAAARTRKGKL